MTHFHAVEHFGLIKSVAQNHQLMTLSCADIESLENVLSLQSLLPIAYAHCGITKYISGKLVTSNTIYLVE